MARLERFASDGALMDSDLRFESGPIMMLQARQAGNHSSERCDGFQSCQNHRKSDGQGQPSFPHVAGQSGKLHILP